MANTQLPLVSVVVIGRNEGRRLTNCLNSIKLSRYKNLEIIYVDSASTDGSIAEAGAHGVEVIEVKPVRPSAALGRNAGWRAAHGDYVLFLDGDTVLHPQFIQRAIQEFESDDVAVVWGHRREVRPEQSLFVRVLDLDWVYPPGITAFCGGDALMRRDVLERTGGFDDTLIAGEEPELCRRIRQLGFVIQHIDAPMTGHDLAIRNFKAYWKRAFRAGHAYAELSARFRNTEDPMWLFDSRRNMIHASGLLLGLLLLAVLPLMVSFLFLAGAALLILRTAHRCRWKSPEVTTRLWYALHSHFQQIPILCGQLSFRRDLRRGRQRALIEYKQS